MTAWIVRGGVEEYTEPAWLAHYVTRNDTAMMHRA